MGQFVDDGKDFDSFVYTFVCVEGERVEFQN